jgi:hypothetical protein
MNALLGMEVQPQHIWSVSHGAHRERYCRDVLLGEINERWITYGNETPESCLLLACCVEMM